MVTNKCLLSSITMCQASYCKSFLITDQRIQTVWQRCILAPPRTINCPKDWHNLNSWWKSPEAKESSIHTTFFLWITNIIAFKWVGTSQSIRGSRQCFLLKRKCPLEYYFVETRKQTVLFTWLHSAYLLIAKSIDRGLSLYVEKSSIKGSRV